MIYLYIFLLQMSCIQRHETGFTREADGQLSDTVCLEGDSRSGRASDSSALKHLNFNIVERYEESDIEDCEREGFGGCDVPLVLSLSLSLSLDVVIPDVPVAAWFFGKRRPKGRTHNLF